MAVYTLTPTQYKLMMINQKCNAFYKQTTTLEYLCIDTEIKKEKTNILKS